MKLKFNPEAKVTEWANGGKYFKNEGQPIEVDPRLGRAMLRQFHEIAPQQFVAVFIEDAPPAPAPKAAADTKKATAAAPPKEKK